jgi:hypothetical protein
MRPSIERAGWMGTVIGGALGAVAGITAFLLDPPPDIGKLTLGLMFCAGMAGSAGAICGAALFALAALIVRVFRKPGISVSGSPSKSPPRIRNREQPRPPGDERLA